MTPEMVLVSLSIKAFDLSKIDVEGNDVDVTKGAVNTITRFKPKIVLETHSL